MVFSAHVLKVLIASPGDTAEEREAVEASLAGWNAARAEREQVILLPWRWEKHAVPVLGTSAQGVINSQAVDSSDIVVALFDTRLGQETPEAVSGTAEEIQRAHAADKPVHVYFSGEPLPRDVDTDQLARLRGFQEALEPLGLLGKYANPQDLGFQVRNAIEHDLAQMGLGSPVLTTSRKRGAVLRPRHFYERTMNGVDSKGRPKYSTKSRIIIKNTGDAPAQDIHLTVTAGPGESDDFRFDGPDRPFDLLPDTERHWPFINLGVNTATVSARWTEDGEERSEDCVISLEH
jgi:hypothetical protein